MMLSDAPGDRSGADGPHYSEPRGVSSPTMSIPSLVSQLTPGTPVCDVGGGLQNLHQDIINISAQRIPH